MTRPTDAAIARGRVKLWFFRDMTDDQRIALLKLFGFPANEMGTHGAQTHGLRHVFDALSAAEFDAESPAGTERGSEEAQLPYWLCCGSLNFHEHHRRVCQATPEICRWGTADEHAAWQQSRPDIVFKFPQKVTTSPERVQIPAESKRVCSCHTCRAEMRPGLRCKNPHCGLKE